MLYYLLESLRIPESLIQLFPPWSSQYTWTRIHRYAFKLHSPREHLIDCEENQTAATRSEFFFAENGPTYFETSRQASRAYGGRKNGFLKEFQ